MFNKNIVRLTDEERSTCEDTVKRLSGSSQKARRACILLHADADGSDPWTDWTGPRRWRPWLESSTSTASASRRCAIT